MKEPEDTSAYYIAHFDVPNKIWIYRIMVSIPGIEESEDYFEEYFIALENTGE